MMEWVPAWSDAAVVLRRQPVRGVGKGLRQGAPDRTRQLVPVRWDDDDDQVHASRHWR